MSHDLFPRTQNAHPLCLSPGPPHPPSPDCYLIFTVTQTLTLWRVAGGSKPGPYPASVVSSVAIQHMCSTPVPDASSCPPCMHPVTLACMGAHGQEQFPCSRAGPWACRKPCGAVLACGNHQCKMACHVRLSDQAATLGLKPLACQVCLGYEYRRYSAVGTELLH